MKANHNHKIPPIHRAAVVINTAKIQKESKSQLIYEASTNFTKLLSNTTKIQKESESQLRLNTAAILHCCYQIRQRYKMKANHNYEELLVKKRVAVIKYDKDTK